jgi:hypothetical protein
MRLRWKLQRKLLLSSLGGGNSLVSASYHVHTCSYCKFHDTSILATPPDVYFQYHECSPRRSCSRFCQYFLTQKTLERQWEMPHLTTFQHHEGRHSVYFVDGQKYLARKVALVLLRHFAARNDIRSSQPTHHALRRGTQQHIVDPVRFKSARRTKGPDDPSHTIKDMMQRHLYR